MIRDFSSAELVFLVSRLTLSGVLFVAGTQKLRAFDRIVPVLEALGLRAQLSQHLVARAVPVLEILLALAVLTGWGTLSVSLCTFLLIAVFNATLWRLRAIGYEAGCACFGAPRASSSGILPLVRNAVLLGAAGVLVWQSARSDGTQMLLWRTPMGLMGPALLATSVLMLTYGILATLEDVMRGTPVRIGDSDG